MATWPQVRLRWTWLGEWAMVEAHLDGQWVALSAWPLDDPESWK